MAKNGFSKLEISLSNLKHNLETIRKIVGPKVKIMAIVKDDAYGHGTNQISKYLEKIKVDYLGVNSSGEALFLRKHGIKKAILVMGMFDKKDLKELASKKIDITISSLQLLDFASQSNENLKCHLKIDTGMNRLGIRPEETLNFVRQIISNKNLNLVGIMSHLPDFHSDKTEKQIEDFAKIKKQISKSFPEKITKNIHFHLANTGGTFFHKNSYFDMVRCGISTYGYMPGLREIERVNLKPILNFSSKIVSLKKISQGESVSYNRRWYAQCDSIVAVIPAGYADGYFRLYANGGKVIVKDEFAPIVGDICMDMFMIDVTNISGVNVGDEVILLGKSKTKEITAYDLAKSSGFIPYEVLTSLSNEIKRVYT